MIWTNEQAAAITATTHTMLVANAGTGKTTTVVGKILWLLGEAVGVTEDDVVIPPCPDPCTLPEIAAITFTEKAAYDLKRKLRRELADSPRAKELLPQLDRAALGTIHSFCGQLLRENALRLGIDAGFRVLDEQETKLRQNTIIRDLIVEAISAGDKDLAEVFREMKLYGSEWKSGTIDYARTVMRDARWHPARYTTWPAEITDEKDARTIRRCQALHRIARQAIEEWERHEQNENVRDYDSLILSTRALLKGESGRDALARIRARYRVLIIDEFQDTDDAQREIADAITRIGEDDGTARPQLFLVGDPKQSIYRFRGADISVWNKVAAVLRHIAEPLPLTRNFRSDPAVIAAVNAAAKAAFAETSALVEQVSKGEAVTDSPLMPARAAEGTGVVEWFEPGAGNAEECRENEAAYVAQTIQQLVGEKFEVIDPETETPRPCRYSDIAVLYRARVKHEPYKPALRAAGIPLHDHSPVGLADRQEIHDILNYLGLVHHRSDDMRAFALLRSPFIGLRDEVSARIRLFTPGATLIRCALNYSRSGEWYEAREHADVVAIEQQALAEGLALFNDARELADRVPVDELVSFILDRSGYRNHLLLLEDHREAIANLSAFVQFCEGYRDLSIGAFLQVWEQRDQRDPGLPQGQIFSARDDFVTFSTIHAAKGLEWPIVFLVNAGSELSSGPANQFWSDAQDGPLLCPRTEDTGTRAERMKQRRAAHERAESARVLYVGLTRARDKLFIAGKPNKDSFGAWLSAIGIERDHRQPEYRVTESLGVSLDWIDRVVEVKPGPLSRDVAQPPHRFLTSATELMTRARSQEEWERKYIHGIEASYYFAAPKAVAEAGKEARVSAAAFGTIVHGVLEKIQEEAELAEILEETLGDLDAPELAAAFAPGTAYRTAVEAEIQRVVRSEEWTWYVSGEHHREHPFVHLVGPREWRIGAFDLYRPAQGESEAWIIDFKTHQIKAEQVAKAAEDYVIQAEIYKAAVNALHGAARMRLHFTHPNVVVDV